ncbi:hypothetical protein G7066_00160 [Leucobacter coleopterorum]|uniref:Alpha/beta-hydrolase family protein n=1 Tax=Leucobacter coleopterorum TaxID=2714933 RepID=A0ABX6JXL4_9MICO|nr:alpha/beta-hydrolase family protein [Leucobacter coleopterorum]QIM17520.1 hypothetical protein G7066_00160 [Leucobacter coleopterorum]
MHFTKRPNTQRPHPAILRPDRAPFLPTLGAVVCAWLALTPSLLPRAALLQGALCAVAALLGYAVGALSGWVLRGFGAHLSGAARRYAWFALLVAAGAGTVVMLVLTHGWQQALRSQVGLEASTDNAFTFGVVALLVACALYAVTLVIARSIRWLGRWLRGKIERAIPVRIAALVTALALMAGGLWVGRELVVGRVAAALDRTYLAVNDEFSTDLPSPTLAEVSGGPGSSETWESLGRQGRIFIANTPTQKAIAQFAAEGSGEALEGTGSNASQPVRVYIGSGPNADDDLEAQAQRAVAELKRTGGFERAVLNVATGTGRGWVNENQARGLEYLWAGDTATVSIQYSYLPSWMSYLVDEYRAREAGRILFDAVYAAWSKLPETERPKLVVSGESLGSFGSEGAFSGAQDLAARTDGALWVGPTANNVLWQQFTRDREAGSPVYLPVVGDGVTVRFSSNGEDWSGAGTWRAPRVGYLQHANDPVTWLDFGIMFQRPEWLAEDAERGPGVLNQMVWIPVITTLQLAVDQLASGIPAGQGHEFGQAPARAWAAILPPAHWEARDTNRLVAELATLQQQDLGSSSSE